MQTSHNPFKEQYNWVLTWFTLELSFAVTQASATHQVTIFCLAVPLLSNAVVVAAVMAPLCDNSS